MIFNILTYLSLVYSFELGYENSGFKLWENYRYADESGTYFIDDYISSRFDISLNIGTAYVGGGIYVPAKMEGRVFQVSQYNPNFDDYNFNFGIKTEHFDIGYIYHCVHPIMTYLDDRAIKSKTEGSYYKVFIKFTDTWKFK